MRSLKRIKKIEIENFQSHKHTVIEPSPGVTVVVGHSDSGKSAFIRAIKWCLYNKAPHSPLINKDADFAKVTVEFDDGTIITRYKSDKDNAYQIVSGGETKTFSSVGNQPLKEVMDSSGMHEVDMFNRQISLNMVEQFDNLFFISENATDKGTLVSQMAQTEVCDNAIAICSTEMSATKKMITQETKALKTEREKLSEFSHVVDLGKDIEVLKEQKKEADALDDSIKALRAAVTLAKTSSDALNSIYIPPFNLQDIQNETANTDSLERSVKTHETIKDNLNTIRRQIDFAASGAFLLGMISISDLEDIIVRINDIQSSIEKSNNIQNVISRLKKDALSLKTAHFSDEEKAFAESIEKEREEFEKGTEHIASLRAKLSYIKKQTEEALTWHGLISKREDAKKQKTKEYETALKESGKCPVCGNDMSEECLNEAVSMIE